MGFTTKYREALKRVATDAVSESEHAAGVTTTAEQHSVATDSPSVLAALEIPEGKTVAIWAAQVDVSGGSSEAVAIEAYDAGGDSVEFSHSYADEGSVPATGSPLVTVGGGGDTYQVRMSNGTASAQDASGYLVWSLRDA